jgi:hypothetical protein
MELADLVRARADFALVMGPVYCNICFWYVPAGLREAVRVGGGIAGGAALDTATRAIARRVNERGLVMIDYSPVCGLPAFFRAISNRRMVTHDCALILDEIAAVGCELFPGSA